MPTVLIVGANRGIGLEFAQRYAADGWTVIATARDPSSLAAAGLGGAVETLGLEVTDPASVAAFATALGDRPLDVAIHNAGIYGPRGMGFGALDYDAWDEVVRVNGLAPLRVAEAIADNVAASDQKKLVAISSRMGSIASNARGGDYIYRSSKALLNCAWHSMAIDLAPRGIVACLFHPGWVRTDMGGAEADISVAESVAGMRQVIAGLTPAASGKLWNYDGAELPW